MNPQFDTIGKTFIQEYYARFDQKATRANAAQLYSVDQSMLSFEGDQVFGQLKIKEKLTDGLPMGNIKRAVTKVDCQPMWDGGVIVSVIGQLQEDAEHSKLMSFSQVFILKSDGAAWFILHEIFRLNMHDF